MNAGKPETRVCRYFFIVYFIMGTICEYEFVLRNRSAILRLKVLFIILPFTSGSSYTAVVWGGFTYPFQVLLDYRISLSERSKDLNP